MMTLIELYTQRIENFKFLLEKQKKKLSFISLLRLASVLLAIYFIVLGVKHEINLMFIISGLLVILFFALVSNHKNKNDRKKHLEQLLKLNEEELNCQNRNLQDLKDGNDYVEADHQWSYDLDIFGAGSIYKYLNRTATHSGPGLLANYLTTPVTKSIEVEKRQALVKELTDQIELRQNFTALSRLMKENKEDFHDLIQWSKRESFIKPYRWTRHLAMAMVAISCVLIGVVIFTSIPGSILLPLIIFNWGVLSLFIMRTNKYQSQISKKHSFLKTYSLLMEIIEKQDFSHPDLIEMKRVCKEGTGAIKKLTRILDMFDQRLNLLVGVALNSLFLFDFHILHRLSDWTDKHSKDLESWLNTIGNFDALFSLAGFAFNHPEHHYPVIDENTTGITATNIGHPMIPSHKRVNNSIRIEDEKVVLITGANMAGKSTFLRSLGINMVLTYAGCPVCADEFKTGNYILWSSMRTSDSLKDEESYFLAEIKRLKRIVEKMEEDQKLFILLDEVLKGTNTTDKQKGSRGLIEKAIRHNVLCFIATHDLALGEMQDQYPGQVVNYCFESYIKDLELSFDYTIRPGLAKNMNASFLMKKMGIMD